MKSIYLVAYYYQKPKQRVKTTRAGWNNNLNNFSWDEKVALTKNLKNRDYSEAKIILDLANKKVIKNGWLNNYNFDDLFKYFEKGYPQYTRNVMDQLDPTYLRPVTAMQSQATTISDANLASEIPSFGISLSST